MPAMEKLQSTTVICQGGLDSNRNWLQINQENPGLASELQNFEPSLFGGYRRIEGFEPLESTDSGEVDPSGAEGKIYGVAIYAGSDIIAARKQQSGATYNFYQYVSGSAWSGYTTGLTLISTSVDKIRHHNFNFDGTDKIIFTDGVNNAALYDGTNWVHVDPTNSGANFANAGGSNALAAPKYTHAWESHVWMAGDSTNPHILAHSAPNAEYDWTAASGAGQINTGMEIKQIYPFRDKLYIFGDDQIKVVKVWENTNTFLIEDATSDIGLYASDSVAEVNGDLIFLAPDGIRPVSGTDRIGDFEIASISKNVQQDVRLLNASVEPTEVHSVVVREKSQFRYFYSDASGTDAESKGILGGLKEYGGNFVWEFARLKGIRVSCATSGYFGSPKSEYVVHGSHDGFVFVQESGNDFNGTAIEAIYSTPYLDFQAPSIRKTLYNVDVFSRPEGNLTLGVALTYDWGIADGRVNPSSYEVSSTGSPSVYGEAVYGTATYGGASAPVSFQNTQGSGKSFKITFSTNTTVAPYSIQGFVVVWEDNGFK